MISMNRSVIAAVAVAGLGALAAAQGCSSSDSPAPAVADTGTTKQSLCEKYGGYDNIKTVVNNLVGTLAADCRINTFFTALTPTALKHVGDCLQIQIGSVMGCTSSGKAVTYPDKDSAGVMCRSMKEAHATPASKGINEADFSALLDDVVKTLQKAGVAQPDIDALGTVLMSLHDDIVQSSGTTPSKTTCAGGDAGPGDAAAGG